MANGLLDMPSQKLYCPKSGCICLHDDFGAVTQAFFENPRVLHGQISHIIPMGPVISCPLNNISERI